MTSGLVFRLCDEFWRRSGEADGFPRDLEPAIAYALPPAITILPTLWSDDLQRWLGERGLPGDVGPQRRLHACLIAARGNGSILLDGRDQPDHRRFSLAHEVGHFLLHYWEPRQRLLQSLGGDVLPVLDGERPPTGEERVQAVLAGLALRTDLHLMERGPGGMI